MAEKDKISSQMCNVLQGRIDSNDNLIKDIEERQEKKKTKRIKMKGSERKQWKWEKSTEGIIFIKLESLKKSKENNGTKLIFKTITQGKSRLQP